MKMKSISKKLKKALALMLAVALVLGFSATALADSEGVTDDDGTVIGDNALPGEGTGTGDDGDEGTEGNTENGTENDTEYDGEGTEDGTKNDDGDIIGLSADLGDTGSLLDDDHTCDDDCDDSCSDIIICSWCDEANCDDSCKICPFCNVESCDWTCKGGNPKPLAMSGVDITGDFASAFLDYLQNMYQFGSTILDTDVENWTDLEIQGGFLGIDIDSLDGIQHFTSLESLAIYDTNVTDLTKVIDLSNQHNLKNLIFNRNGIASYIFNNTGLKYLSVGGLNITDITVTSNALLEEFYLTETGVTTLTLEDHPALIGIGFSDTPIEELTLKNLAELTDFDFYGISETLEKLTLIDLPLYITDDDFEHWDGTSLTTFTAFFIHGLPNLKEINITNLQAIQYIALWNLPELITVNFSNLTNVERVQIIFNTKLANLNFSTGGFTSLTNIDVQGNRLTGINVNSTPTLNYLNVSFNKLGSVADVTGLGGRDSNDDFEFNFFPQLSESITAALGDGVLNDDYPLIALSDDTIITVADLEAIRNSGVSGVTIILPNGHHIYIPADKITNPTKDIDLAMEIEWVWEEDKDVYGVKVPQGSTIIRPVAQGEFGFTIEIGYGFSYDTRAERDSTKINLQHISSTGVITDFTQNLIITTSDYSEGGETWWHIDITIQIKSASAYVLSSSIQPSGAGTTETPSAEIPQGGDFRTVIIPIIGLVLGVSMVAGALYFRRKLNKTAA